MRVKLIQLMKSNFNSTPSGLDRKIFAITLSLLLALEVYKLTLLFQWCHWDIERIWTFFTSVDSSSHSRPRFPHPSPLSQSPGLQTNRPARKNDLLETISAIQATTTFFFRPAYPLPHQMASRIGQDVNEPKGNEPKGSTSYPPRPLRRPVVSDRRLLFFSLYFHENSSISYSLHSINPVPVHSNTYIPFVILYMEIYRQFVNVIFQGYTVHGHWDCLFSISQTQTMRCTGNFEWDRMDHHLGTVYAFNDS